MTNSTNFSSSTPQLYCFSAARRAFCRILPVTVGMVYAVEEETTNTLRIIRPRQTPKVKRLHALTDGFQVRVHHRAATSQVVEQLDGQATGVLRVYPPQVQKEVAVTHRMAILLKRQITRAGHVQVGGCFRQPTPVTLLVGFAPGSTYQPQIHLQARLGTRQDRGGTQHVECPFVIVERPAVQQIHPLHEIPQGILPDIPQVGIIRRVQHLLPAHPSERACLATLAKDETVSPPCRIRIQCQQGGGLRPTPYPRQARQILLRRIPLRHVIYNNGMPAPNGGHHGQRAVAHQHVRQVLAQPLADGLHLLPLRQASIVKRVNHNTSAPPYHLLLRRDDKHPVPPLPTRKRPGGKTSCRPTGDGQCL